MRKILFVLMVGVISLLVPPFVAKAQHPVGALAPAATEMHMAGVLPSSAGMPSAAAGLAFPKAVDDPLKLAEQELNAAFDLFEQLADADNTTFTRPRDSPL